MTGPLHMPTRTGRARSPIRPTSSSAARAAKQARAAWSSVATGAPNSTMTPSPIRRLTTPPKRVTALAMTPTTEPRAWLASSASIFETSSVEPHMSANRIVTCFCWAPDVSGPAEAGLLSSAANAVPQLAQKRALGRLATEHERQIFSNFAPQLSQYCPGSALLCPHCGQATCISPRDGSATSWLGVVDHVGTDPAGLRPGLPPPHACRPDRAG